MSKNEIKDLGSINSVKWNIITWQESITQISKELTENGDEIKEFVWKVLEIKTCLEAKKIKDLWELDKYVNALGEVKKINIEITEETRNKLINFVDFFSDELSDWIIEQLDNIIFNWNPNLEMLQAYMEIDSEENWEIYKQLITILQEIKVS